jgi:hypothetical protein
VCRPATGRGCDNNRRAVGNDLSQLLKAETAEQEVRSVASQLKARFPVYRALAGFDFSSSEINEALVRQLHRCVVEPVDNVVLVGTGKTRIATSLGCSRRQIGGFRSGFGIWH